MPGANFVKPSRDMSETMVRELTTRRAEFWNRARKRQMLALFHSAAFHVPAYKHFLKKHRINPGKIRNLNDFMRVPITNKKNYLYEYPLEKLVWDGKMRSDWVLAATSGSTGEPFYFPRSRDLSWESSILHEFFLKNCLRYKNEPTLVIIGFGMGVWIGGLITFQAFEEIGARGYPVSILAPGVNKKEIFHALRKLAPHYPHTILVGYPPFIKDVIDECEDQKIDLKKLNLHLLFAAESFSEEFRDYVASKTNLKNIYLDTLNIYGTADIGTMAYETPTSILVRRLALTNAKLFMELLGSVRVPTLAQYNPFFINFESVENEVVLTGKSAIPLMRYAIGDRGGAFDFSHAEEVLRKFKLDLKAEAKKEGIDTRVTEMPFVFVYERSDFSANIYGLQVYPEMIKSALLTNILAKYVTGKFAMQTRFDRHQNQYWEINIELRKNKIGNSKIKDLALKKIKQSLFEKSSEFRELYGHIGERTCPRIVFRPAEDPRYFNPGAKQRWVIQ